MGEGSGELFATFTSRFAMRSGGVDIFQPPDRPGLPYDGLKHIAGIFHARKGTPVTWFLDLAAAQEHGKQFRTWHEEYGDEVALWLDEFGPKTWLKGLGIEYRGQKSLRYSLDEQRTMIRFVKEHLERETYGPLRTAAGLWFNEVTVKALEEEGFSGLWGYCWHQENVDEATHRGCPWYPFYPSTTVGKVPSQERAGIVGLPWFITDMTNAHFACENHNIGFVRIALHPGEEDRSGFSRDGSHHTRKTLAEWNRQRGWNDFVYTTFHLECDWVSGQWYHLNEAKHEERTMELFKSYLREITRFPGARIVTAAQFTDWFRERHDTTSTQCFYFRDTIPERRVWFKDRPCSDTLFYGSGRRKLVFTRDRGTLPIEVLDYAAQHPTDPSQRYPGVPLGPDVFTNMGCEDSFGVWLEAGNAQWKAKLELTSTLEMEEFGVAFWNANIPPFLSAGAVAASDNVRDVRFFSEQQAVLALFDLKVGRNLVELHAPVEHVAIAEILDRGHQVDVLVENRSAQPLALAGLEARVGTGHHIKDIFFDTRSIPSTYCSYGGNALLQLRCTYPETFLLQPGMNVFEVIDA